MAPGRQGAVLAGLVSASSIVKKDTSSDVSTRGTLPFRLRAPCHDEGVSYWRQQKGTNKDILKINETRIRRIFVLASVGILRGFMGLQSMHKIVIASYPKVCWFLLKPGSRISEIN